MRRRPDGAAASPRPPRTLATAAALLRFSPTHARLIPLLVAIGLAASLAESFGVSLVVLLFYSLTGRAAEAAAASGILGRAFAAVIEEIGGGAMLAAAIFGLIAANAALRLGNGLIAASIRYRLCEAARNRLHQQFLEVSYDFILGRDRGQLYNVLVGESWSMGEMYMCICRILINISSIVIFVLFLLLVSWQLLLIAGGGITLLLGGLHYLSGPARRLGRLMREKHEILAERALAMLQGMRALRAFGQEARYHRAFEAASAEARRVSMAFERLNALVSPTVRIGCLALLAAIILVSGPIGVSFAATLAFSALFYRLQPHVHELKSNLLHAAGLEATARNVIGMLNRSDKTYLTSGATPFAGLRREIRFERVSFAYPGAPSPCLDRISFAIPAGEVTALVGRSGAGKTTIVNLLLRLCRPDAGSIAADGVSLDALDRAGWLRRIAAAGQDVELVEGTVRDNLRLAAPQADLAAIRAAAATAGILEVIESLPEGYDSWIGQQGLKLSGGQRQRLGLARALLRDPDILILDEAVNALDSGLEREIWAAVRRKMAGRTVLAITHRLETIMSADRVICIGSGRVLECGSPAELASRPASELWRLLRQEAGVREVAAGG